MTDHTKEEIERGIDAVRWSVSALVSSLHRTLSEQEDEGISQLSNELRKALETIDDAWDAFCARREMGEYAPDEFGTFGRGEPVVPPGEVLVGGQTLEEIEAEPNPYAHISTHARADVTAEEFFGPSAYPPIPGADKPNPLRRPTSEGEAQMRMEREMALSKLRELPAIDDPTMGIRPLTYEDDDGQD